MGKFTGAFCDLCQARDGEVATWEIKTPDGSKVALDLCTEHGQPLAALLDKAPKAAWLTNKSGAQRRPRVVPQPEML